MSSLNLYSLLVLFDQLLQFKLHFLSFLLAFFFPFHVQKLNCLTERILYLLLFCHQCLFLHFKGFYCFGDLVFEFWDFSHPELFNQIQRWQLRWCVVFDLVFENIKFLLILLDQFLLDFFLVFLLFLFSLQDQFVPNLDCLFFYLLFVFFKGVH